ncbi:MAG: hypothetical protein J5595_02910 [Bacteroidales bacterium]|nr:hypothetical protein [Bacteroidales bacterium]
MKRILFLVAIAAMIAACNHPYGSKIPEKYIGNYYYCGEWVYGLYEEFAIYQKDFWDYESASENQIVLSKKSGEKVTLNLKSYDEWGSEGNRTIAMFFNGKQCDRCDDHPRIFLSHAAEQRWVLEHGAFKDDTLERKMLEDMIAHDTITLQKHHYGIDSAVVRLYLRNTAKGIEAFANRELNREKHIQVLNYLESKDVVALPLDSTDHYGYRYEFKIPVTGVSELPMYNLFNHRFTGWNSTAGESMNYIVQPGDTLMFYAWEDCLLYTSDHVYGFIDCSGGNRSYNAEKTTLGGSLLWSEPNPQPLLKFEAELAKIRENYSVVNMWNAIAMHATNHWFSSTFGKIHDAKNNYVRLMHLDQKSDTLKTVFPIDEDEIFSTVTAYNFVINYILQNADTLSSTPENLAKHPDWIVAENEDGDTAKLLDPAFIKSLGLSDDFIEFFRLMHAVQFYDDFSPVTGLKDFELQSVMKNLTRDDYKRYLEDKMKKN